MDRVWFTHALEAEERVRVPRSKAREHPGTHDSSRRHEVGAVLVVHASIVAVARPPRPLRRFLRASRRGGNRCGGSPRRLTVEA